MPAVPPEGAAGEGRVGGGPDVTYLDCHRGIAEWKFDDLSGYQCNNLAPVDGGAGLALGYVQVSQGAEFTICATAKDEHEPAVAANSRGNLIVAWTRSAMGERSAVLVQRLSSYGKKIGDAFEASPTGKDPRMPAVTLDSGGNFLVALADSRTPGTEWDIYAQRFDGDGNRSGAEIPVAFANGSEQSPFLHTDSNDNSFIAWTHYYCETSDLLGRRFDSQGNGIGDLIMLANSSYIEAAPAIASFSDNSYLFTWTDQRLGPWSSYARKLDENGSTVGEEIVVCTEQNAEGPAAAVGPDDDFIITWIDPRNTTWDVWAQRFDSNGTRLGDEISVCNATGNQWRPQIVSDSHGNFFVVWMDYRCGRPGIYARAFDRSGKPVGGEVAVSTGSTDQWSPAVAIDGNGTVTVVWESGPTDSHDILARQFGIRTSRYRSGKLLTPDLSAANLCSWQNLSVNASFQDPANNSLRISYSTDGGTTWKALPSNGSLAEAPTENGRIRFMAELFTTGYLTSPVLIGLQLDFLVDRPPVITAFPPDGPVPKNRPLPLVCGATDEDGDPLTFDWKLVAGNPGNALLMGASTFNASIEIIKSGNYSVRLTVSDGYLAAVRTLNLAAVNRPPVITGPASFFMFKRTSIPLPLNASDEDNDTLTFSWGCSDRHNVTFSDARIPSPVLTVDGAGNYSLNLTVSDGESSVSAELPVRAVGRPPTANLSANRTALRAGELVRFDAGLSSDPDGDGLEYYVEFGDGQNTGWSSAPGASHAYIRPGAYRANLTVRDIDGNLSSPATRELTVLSAGNRPPSIQLIWPPANATVNGSEAELSWQASDPDGDALFYKVLRVLPNGTTSLTVTNLTRYALTGLENGTTYLWKVVASDGLYLTESSTWSFNVIFGYIPNRPPVLPDVKLPKATAGKSFRFKLTAFDADNDSLLFSLLSGPVGLNVDGDGTILWKPKSESSGPFTIRVAVSDGKSNDTREYVITVEGAKKTGSVLPGSTMPASAASIIIVTFLLGRSRRKTPT